jgi:hypothetical protein
VILIVLPPYTSEIVSALIGAGATLALIRHRAPRAETPEQAILDVLERLRHPWRARLRRWLSK